MNITSNYTNNTDFIQKTLFKNNLNYQIGQYYNPFFNNLINNAKKNSNVRDFQNYYTNMIQIH